MFTFSFQNSIDQLDPWILSYDQDTKRRSQEDIEPDQFLEDPEQEIDETRED